MQVLEKTDSTLLHMEQESESEESTVDYHGVTCNCILRYLEVGGRYP